MRVEFASSLIHTHLLNADVLQKRPSTPTLKHHAINYLATRTGSFEYTLGVLNSLEGQLRDEIARLSGNEGLERIIDTLSVKDLGKKPE